MKKQSHSHASSQDNNDNAAVRATAAALLKPPAGGRTPPAGFLPPSSFWQGSTPKVAELAVLRQAVAELQGFSGYEQAFGQTAPSYGVLIASLESASAWSHDRRESEAWTAYSVAQEGIAWKSTRKLVGDLRAAFLLAASHDSSILARLPALARFYGVNKDIAARGARKRAANKKAKGQGTAPAMMPVAPPVGTPAAEPVQPAAPMTPTAAHLALVAPKSAA